MRCGRGGSPSASPPAGGGRPPILPAQRCSSHRRRRITSMATCWPWTAAGWPAETAMAVATLAATTDRTSDEGPAAVHPFVRFFSRFVGPAALTAAGMIGAGAVSTRLLAGAWFGFGLLWVAIYVIPMVIVTLDSASRVAMTSGGRGMIEMIRSEIGPWVAWLIFAAAFLVNLVVNMSQMAAMVEGTYGAFGSLPPPTAGVGFGL